MESKKKVSPWMEVILVDDKRWNKIVENQIKFIEVAKEWVHGCVLENVRKVRLKLKNVWIDLIRSIYAPYISILPSILHAYPGPSQSMQPHSITDPPPKFTVLLSSLSLSLSPTLFQAHFLPSDPRQLILVSSDHTTLLQSSRVQSLCLIAKSVLSFLCFV